MVEPIYNKCFKVAIKINEEVMPEMLRSFEIFYSKSNELLNDSYINSAINKAGISTESKNRNVTRLLSAAVSEANNLKNLRNKAFLELSDMRSGFLSEAKVLSTKNLNYVSEIKEGNVPAEDLLIQLVSLGKDIQSVLSQDIQNYKTKIQSIFSYMTESANNVNSLIKEARMLDPNALS
jgi:hypothetical protein